MPIILDKEQRDEWFNELSPEQKDFLQHHVKRGKKTVFANVLAKDKGIVIPPDVEGEELEHLLDDWVLEDYIDNGYVNPDTPCECGRPLRYQYIVRHKATDETRCFGMTHFEEHTGFPAELVRKIKSGFQSIEYELDELLTKLRENWTLEKEIPQVPVDFSFPDDVQKHLEANVPLLERQVRRVKQKIASFFQNESTLASPVRQRLEDDRSSEEEETSLVEEVTLNLFNENPLQFEGTNHPYPLPFDLQHAVRKYLTEGVSSARIICELLIKNCGASNERYQSERPKVYVAVCFYLDSLARLGDIHFVGSRGLDDRYYKL